MDRRAAGRPARRHQPGRRALDDLVRPPPGGPGRPAHRPALDPAGHRLPPARVGLLDRARGRPHRLLGGRRRAPGRRGPGRQAGPDRRPQHALPGQRRSATTPRWLRGRPSSARSRRASSGPAHRRRGSAARRAARGRSVRRARAPGWRRTASTAALLSLLPGGGDRGRRRPGPVGRGRRAPLGRRRPGRSRCCRGWCPRRCSPGWCWRLLVLGVVRLAAARDAAGRVPGAQPGRPPGLGDDPGPRRRPHLAVPALLLAADPALAATAGRPDRPGRRGVDGADDPVPHHRQRPRLPRRRHPDRRLRAGRRLAAHRAGEDREARVRRQLRHGRARVARCPKRALVAVLSAAPQRKTAKAGASWLGSPPARLRRTAEVADDERTYAPADPAAGGPRGLGGGPAGARCWSSVALYGAVALVALAVLDRRGRGRRLAAARRARRLADAVPRGPGRGRGRRCVAKWLLVGRLRPGQPPAVELVRLAQRARRTPSSRWWPPRGSPVPSPAPRC